ncbi:uncharacterized protein LOC130361049 [Hyla sarda]|uniref:uncharacterized protein LOC130361049 n=1 Tax=Hyla sarda TaxID=327740 RepID=UPI0024C28592|nr:uncharacterized protein LOC130361049 [Hyla sarda]
MVTLPQATFECDNLLSAVNDPAVVTELINAELMKGYMIGPLLVSPFRSWRVSPVGVVTGKFNGKKRLIFDLSAPHGSLIPSINSLIPSEEFSMHYSSIDQAIQVILALGPGTWMAKADITDAFKLLPLHRDQWQWFGLKWQGAYYFASKLTFGCKSSPWLFDQLAQALHWLLVNVSGCSQVIHYLDDFLLLSRPREEPDQLVRLLKLFTDIGVPVSPKKTVGPTKCLTFLGVILDSVAMQVSLPTDKLNRIRDTIHKYTVSQVTTKGELQSLLGMLAFAMRAIPQGRAFVSRILSLLHGVPHQHSRVWLDCQALADLNS